MRSKRIDLYSRRINHNDTMTHACNDCKQGERRRSAGDERLDSAEVEALRLPQRPHSYAGVGSTQTTSAQDHGIPVDDEVSDSL